MPHDDPPPAHRGSQLELFGCEPALEPSATPEKMCEYPCNPPNQSRDRCRSVSLHMEMKSPRCHAVT
jgi:hypothetical protein